TGVEVATALPVEQRPWIVFITAYDRYAVQAFEASAVDYVVKPIAEERLRRAVAHLRERSAHANLHRVLAALQREPGRPRIVGRHRHTWHVLPIESVEAFVAERELVFALTQSGRFLVSKTLRELEARLDRRRFTRVHKGAIV